MGAGVIIVSRERGRRRAAWVSGIALAITCAAAALWWLLPAPREGVRLSAEARSFPWSRAPSTIEPPAPQREDVNPARPALPATPGPTTFDLCGLGRIVVASGAGDKDSTALAGLPAPVGRFPLQEAQARLVQTLAAGEAKQRVAARLLQQPAEDDPAALAAWAPGLVADALASGDAQALRWAGAACPFVADEAQCRQRLARARVQAEPANALHWLDWASEEPAAAEAAWAGLTRASYWREHPLGLAGVLLRAVPGDIPGYLQSALAVDAMSHDVAFPAPPFALVLERCQRKPGGGAPAACDSLARLLLERSDSVQGLMLGRELGEHLAWPTERLRRIEQDIEALQKQEAHWSVDAQRPLGCETVDGQRSHIAAVEREGELAVLRRNLAAAAQAPR